MTNGRLWIKAQKLSFVWKRHFQGGGQTVTLERRAAWAELIYWIFERCGEEPDV